MYDCSFASSASLNASLDAKVQLFCEGELYDFVKSVEDELATVFITSQVEVVNGTDGSFTGEVEGLSVTVLPAEGEKCNRCWSFSDTVGSDEHHPDVCARCAAVLG